MTPLDWAFLPLQRYFVFYGRSPRAEYWWFFLFQMILSMVTTLIDLVLGLGGADSPVSTNMILALALFVPSLAVTVRRLHDINRSGWTVMVYLLMTIAVSVVGVVLSAFLGGFGIVLLVLGMVVVSVSFLILLVTDGNPGENGYGHHPYGRTYGC
ncbi:MAG: DUF805 domain-containing protein [Sphingomicrobium sp.]